MQDAQRHLRPDLTTDTESDLLTRQLARRHTVHGEDLIARAQSRCLTGRSVKHGDDLYRPVLKAHRHADPTKRALRLLTQRAEHLGRHIDRMRITERGDHPVDGTIHECTGVGRVHVTRLDELHYAEQADNIIAVDAHRAQEDPRRKHRQHTAAQNRDHGGQNNLFFAHILFNSLMSGVPPAYKYDSGLTGSPFSRTSKWQCGPVELPVDPQ